jgi:hypothetical protein
MSLPFIGLRSGTSNGVVTFLFSLLSIRSGSSGERVEAGTRASAFGLFCSYPPVSGFSLDSLPHPKHAGSVRAA